MNYRNLDLVSVSVDVDTSALDARLVEISALDEDRVRELIAEDSVTDESVRDIVRDMISDEDFDSRISDLENLNTCSVDINTLADIPERVEALEGAETGDYDNIVERLDSLEEGLKLSAAVLTDRLDSLTEQVKAQDSAIDALAEIVERFNLHSQRIAELETQLSSRPAVQGMTLFELLSQAARILGIVR
jgi:hypothetical protein